MLRNEDGGGVPGAGASRKSDERAQALVDSIARSPLACIVTDARLHDNPIVGVNDAFVELTGYGRDEVIGRNCRFLGGSATEPEARDALRRAVEEGSPTLVEITNYRKDGSAFRNAVMLAPLRDDDGELTLFVGSQMDVSGDGAGGSRRTRARQLVARLTVRQRQVLKLMTAGYRNKQIGGELGIDEKTVKMHRARLLDALGVSASASAVRIAVEADLEVSDPD